MTEQLISFETAKVAKEKGFDIKCEMAYPDMDVGMTALSVAFGSGKQVNEALPAPTQSLLQKWLREKHCIYVFAELEVQYTREVYTDDTGQEVNPHYIPEGWMISIHDDERNYPNTIYKKSYEDALESGLQEALKLIK